MLLEIDIRIISGVSTLIKDPFPFLWCVKRAAGELPVEKVGLLFFIAVRLYGDVLFGSFAHSLDLLHCFLQFIVVEIVQSSYRDHEIENTISNEKTNKGE